MLNNDRLGGVWFVLGCFFFFLLLVEEEVSTLTPVIHSGSSKLKVQHSEI